MTSQLTFGRVAPACLAAGLALGTGCAQSSEGAAAAQICPDCAALEPGGGSTSEASLAACALAYLQQDVDRERAEALGFPVRQVATAIERPIDAPMTWVAKETEGGGPAAGYERETRIRGAFKVESYEHRWLDPALCDGTVCTIEGRTSEQAPCDAHIIMMHVSGQLTTLDGAVTTAIPSQAVNLLRPGRQSELQVAAYADLGKARGTLTIDPDVPPPRVGRLDLSLQLADEQHRGYGVLSVSVLPADAPSIIAGPLAYYSPIEAHWGDVPRGHATAASP